MKISEPKKIIKPPSYRTTGFHLKDLRIERKKSKTNLNVLWLALPYTYLHRRAGYWGSSNLLVFQKWVGNLENSHFCKCPRHTYMQGILHKIHDKS